MQLTSVASPLYFCGFIALVLAMLALDLGVFHRKAHEVSLKEAAAWSAVWVLISGLFNLFVFARFGRDPALEFTTGYLIEKALAVDNIFVFVMVFKAFGVPARYQHRVLFWGVLGALQLRALFIFLGGELLQHFELASYAFGAVLTIAGARLLAEHGKAEEPKDTWLLRALRRVVPIAPEIDGAKFLVLRDGKRFATPLLVALLALELSDLVFAVDSIPAIFAVTLDPFILLTSNIFAVLGLRSMYFVLSSVLDKLVYLKLGLAFVLIFVGAKMLVAELYEPPVWASLAIIAAILGISAVASLIKSHRVEQLHKAEPAQL